jgi:gamma-glutamylcyclotransferase (GGCT)/AIG2-like uncharacterized protein YtfP
MYNSSGIAKLFVYGTLKRGGCNHFLLVKAGIQWMIPARTRGRLVNTGDYPAMFPTSSGPWTFGELVLLTKPKRAFRILDPLEGAGNVRENAARFRRVRVSVWAAGRWHVAWAYAGAGRYLHRSTIVSGRWQR